MQRQKIFSGYFIMRISNKFHRYFVVVLAFILSAGTACAQKISATDYEDALSSARLGDTSQLVQLLKRGVDPDSVDPNGNTLLILAAREGNTDTVKALLAFKPKVAYRNPAGDSALMLAALRGYDELVKILLDAGAPINNEGWTALHYAAFEGHLSMVDRLLAAGADVKALTPNQANALMLAARNGHVDVVRRLLKTDINLWQRTDQGASAEDWAMGAGNTDIADLIRAEKKRRPQPPAASEKSLKIEIN